MGVELSVCLQKSGSREQAESFARKMGITVGEKTGDGLTVVFDKNGVSMTGFGLTFQADFEEMLHRVTNGRLSHEMLIHAAKSNKEGLTAIDATAGMGEDAFLLAAYGYRVTLFEQDPVVAVLLKDALRRGRKHPVLKDIVARMELIEANSIDYMKKLVESVDVIYLDPMFPERQKSSLINKKLQLIQKLEPPCSDEEELFAAAEAAPHGKIIVKRPLKSPNLAGRVPNHTINGKAIRYDCYT